MTSRHGETDESDETQGGPDRGRTTIPSRVVARIAEQAAFETDHVGARAGGVLGIGAKRDFDSRPSAECDLYGRSAVIRLDIGADFPHPLAATITDLRERVRDRVESLTGLDVARLDVDISWLRVAADPGRRLR